MWPAATNAKRFDTHELQPSAHTDSLVRERARESRERVRERERERRRGKGAKKEGLDQRDGRAKSVTSNMHQ